MPRPPKGLFRRGPSYYVRLYGGGKERWVSLGSDYEEAVRKLRRIRRGETPLVRLSVADAAKHWLDTYVKTSRNQKGIRLAKARAEKYLLPKLGYKRLDAVTANDARLYRTWLEKQGITLQTVAHVLSDFRCLMLWAEDSGYVLRSPVPRKLLPRIQERPPDRLTDAEIERVTALPYPWGFVCRFALETGLRWGEMTRAKVSDAENGVLFVYRTKSGRMRKVPLSDSFLKELAGRVGRIVPFGERSSGAFARVVREKSGVRRFHVHQLRHTFACRWLERGGGIEALRLILGHSTILTTERYARLTDASVFGEAKRVQTVAEAVAGEGRAEDAGNG
jgi:integrase